jgi:hypothetical protein
MSEEYTFEFTFAQYTFRRVYTIRNNDFAKFYFIVSGFFTDGLDIIEDELDKELINTIKSKFPELTKQWNKDMDDDYFTLCDFFQTNFIITDLVNLGNNVYKISWNKGHEYRK